jgi:ribonuclease VapC
MFVDASALVAILLAEKEADDLIARLLAADRRLTSPIAIYEAVLAVMRENRLARVVAEQNVRELLADTSIEVVPITEEMGRVALDAFDRYGKGRGHPARLNMGDCFSYAAARVLAVPFLYKGEDFKGTELG